MQKKKKSFILQTKETCCKLKMYLTIANQCKQMYATDEKKNHHTVVKLRKEMTEGCLFTNEENWSLSNNSK